MEHGEVVVVRVDRGDLGVRVDRVLLRHLAHVPGISRNRLQRLIAAGAVAINGEPVQRASERVPPDAAISIRLPGRKPRRPVVAEDAPLDVRYEDEHLIVINKPAGQVSHPAIRHATGTLLNALAGHAGGRWTPALVTRLDKGTSGLVLVAKSGLVQAALQRLSTAARIEKDYLAVVAGKPPAKGTIDLALNRDPWDRRRVTVRDRGGVPSVTRFERLRSIPRVPEGFLSLVRCRLITGRMHQIRVHLAARAWPILGDPLYGVAFPGLDRQALHAWRVAFPHPFSGGQVDVTAPAPADLAAVLRLFEMREVG